MAAPIDTVPLTPALYCEAKQFALEVLDKLGLPDSLADDAIGWLWDAQWKLRLPIAFVERGPVELPIDGCIIPKPCDFTRLVSLRIGGQMPYYKVLNPSIVRSDCGNCAGSNQWSPFAVEIHDLYFKVWPAPGDCTTAELVYESYGLDAQGYPVFDRRYFDALKAYVKYAYREFKNGRGDQTVTDQMVRAALQDFNIAAFQNRSMVVQDSLTQDLKNQIGQQLRDSRRWRQNPLLRLNDFRNANNNVGGGYYGWGGYGGAGAL